MSKVAGNWYQKHRMEWIAEALRVFGFINREHLIRKFGMSESQASNDLQMYQRSHPGTIEYDSSAKP